MTRSLQASKGSAMIRTLAVIVLFGLHLSSSQKMSQHCRAMGLNQCLTDQTLSQMVYYIKALQFYRAFNRTFFVCDGCPMPDKFPDLNATYVFTFNPPGRNNEVCAVNKTKLIGSDNMTSSEVQLCPVNKRNFDNSYFINNPTRHLLNEMDFSFGCSDSYLTDRTLPSDTPSDNRTNDSIIEERCPPLTLWGRLTATTHTVLTLVAIFLIGLFMGVLPLLCCYCRCKVGRKRTGSGTTPANKSNTNLGDQEEELVAGDPSHRAQTGPPPQTYSKPRYAKLAENFSCGPAHHNNHDPCVIWSQPDYCDVIVDQRKHNSLIPDYDEVPSIPHARDSRFDEPLYEPTW